jgi:outer membrane protein OmpA-like peptidoglycan-associated protein
MSVKKARFALFLAAVLAAASPGVALADCKAKTAAFNSAVASRSIPQLFTAYNDIVDDSACDFDIDDYRLRVAEALIDAAGAPANESQREAAIKFVLASAEVATNWRIAEKLGDFYARTGQQTDALKWYEKATDYVTMPDAKASRTEIQTLVARTAAAKIVANDDDEGRKKAPFVPSVRLLDGSVGGLYSRALRAGAESVPVPVPINFVYAQANFTENGQKACEELAQALKEQNVRAVHLIGHADPRGDPSLNKVLSRQRAEKVKAFLANSGVTADITTDGAGADQQFDVSVLGYQPTQQDIWALDRRVEFTGVQ